MIRRTLLTLPLAVAFVSCGPQGSPDRAGGLSPGAIDSGAPKLLPRDEADESFRRFRGDLLAALGRRDTTFLFGVLAPDIRNSFGDLDSVSGFRRQWQPGEPGSPVWRSLTRLLELGGRLEDDTVFVAPYVYAFWPDTVDAFTHLAVTTLRAEVRSRPSPDAPLMGTASLTILQLAEWTGLHDRPTARDTVWARVVMPDGTRGWVRGDQVYSPIGWRGIFVRSEGRWRLSVLVAGD